MIILKFGKLFSYSYIIYLILFLISLFFFLNSVGKSAADNDILSIDKDYRDDNDWWLHVSNYPGSHVVIRYQDDDLESKYPITLIEAALLAIKSSKVPLTNEIKLTLSRPKYVKKLINYKDGLVCVTKSSVLKINYNKEKHRLDSLKKITSN